MAAVKSVKVKKAGRPGQRKDYVIAYLMVAPAIIGLIILNIVPFLETIYMSFSKSALFGAWEFAGLSNYIKMLQDSEVWQTTLNTLLFVVYTVPVGVALALILAVFINSEIRGRTIFRAIYFLPMVVAPAAVAMVWKWMFNTEFGIINNVLSSIGLPTTNWITNPSTVMLSCGIVAIWSAVGYDAILLMSGLQAISTTYYEAAKIDGAGSIKQFFSITVPLISPTMFFVVIMRTMSSLKVFDLIYMMIEDSNPAVKNARPLLGLFYRYSFEIGNKGYGSVIVLWTFFIISIFTVIQFVGQKKWVNYDA